MEVELKEVQAETKLFEKEYLVGDKCFWNTRVAFQDITDSGCGGDSVHERSFIEKIDRMNPLKRAILWKEILDKPVGLRDQHSGN